MNSVPFASHRGLVKICGLRRPADAEAAVAAGADLIGFVFAESKRRVTPDAAAEAIAAARASAVGPVGVVGVFVNATPDEIEAVVSVTGLDVVQLLGEPPRTPEDALSRPLVRVLRQAPGTSMATLVETIERERSLPVPPLAWLVDGYHPTAHGGAGVTADWVVAAELARRAPVMLAGGLTPENVADAIATARPRGVDVSSGVETDGGKDPARIAEFVRRARAAFAALEDGR